MKIHSICVVKNERDVIESCLRAALEWSDYIYVLDNGSTDGTWEAVKAMAGDRILPWRQDPRPFRNSIRGDVFRAFRSRATDGDWWCRLDADEFYIDDPRSFLARVPRRHHVVWAIAIEYLLTPEDVERIDFDRPFEAVIPELRHYVARHSEPRFFRHRRRLRWPPDGSWPAHIGVTHPARLRYRHYQYRSPTQIQVRLDTRRAAIESGMRDFGHAAQRDWREKIVDLSEVELDRRDGTFVIRHDLLPDHVGSRLRRLFKHFMHGTGLWP